MNRCNTKQEPTDMPLQISVYSICMTFKWINVFLLGMKNTCPRITTLLGTVLSVKFYFMLVECSAIKNEMF